MKLNLIENKSINLNKWNDSVKKSLNSNVCAFSWYLNILDDDWYAIVDEHYHNIMPVFATKRNNKLHGYTPVLGSYYGIYSQQTTNLEVTDKFINILNEHLASYTLTLNKYMQVERSDISVTSKPIFELDLIQPYLSIAKHFSNELITRLSVAKDEKVTIINGLRPMEFLNFINDKNNPLDIKYNSHELAQLRLIITSAIRYRMGQMTGAYTKENNLCAIAFLIWGKNKTHIKFLAANNEGIKNNAIYLLLNNYILEKAEKNVVFSAESGSYVQNAEALAQFGAIRAEIPVITKTSKQWWKLTR